MYIYAIFSRIYTQSVSSQSVSLKDGAYFFGWCAHVLRITQGMVMFKEVRGEMFQSIDF